jgi:aspartate 1-decarboxylase
MLRCFLRNKIHMATVTEANLHYEGSITIDAVLMKKAGILPYEQVQVSNVNNGERFETYAIPGKRGEICLNGPTARKGVPGDKVIIFTYAWLDAEKLKSVSPVVIKLDAKNRPVK